MTYWKKIIAKGVNKNNILKGQVLWDCQLASTQYLFFWVISKEDALSWVYIFNELLKDLSSSGHMISATTIKQPVWPTREISLQNQFLSLGARCVMGPLALATRDLGTQIEYHL
jgi:hypothetical protein